MKHRVARAAPVIAALTFGLAGLGLGATPASAQEAPEASQLTGRVLYGDSAVAGTLVTLHRITPDSPGEVSSVVTDSAGTFNFLLQPVPEAAFTVYFATAEFNSVRFFGRAIRPEEASDDYVVPVYDTAFALPDPVRLARRDVVLVAETDGTWLVNELVKIFNPGSVALVAAAGEPTWQFEIPEGATDFQASSADGLPQDVTWMDNRVVLMTPVPPGSRELLLRYGLPASPARASLPIGVQTDTMSIYVRQPSPLTSITGMESVRPIEVDGEQFLEYYAASLPSGTSIQFEWNSAAAGPPIDPVATAVGVTLVLIGIGIWSAIRNQRQLT